MVRKIKDAAHSNPGAAIVLSMGALAAAAITIWQGVQLADDLILTPAEALVIHEQYDHRIAGLEEQLQANEHRQECRWLSDKLDALEYEIYVLERDAADPDYLQSKRRTRDKIKRRFDALDCASVIT